MTFHVGQRVVCVDDSPSSDGWPSLVKVGAIYTIDEAFEHWSGRPGVTLYEVKPWPHNSGWHAHRFRPITERKTDISIFQRMLTGLPNELEKAQ